MQFFNFPKFIFLIFVLLTFAQINFSQNNFLKPEIEKIIQNSKGIVGVSVLGLDQKFSLNINDEHKFPMQSVYKFPLAMAVLDQVDKGRFSLNQKIKIEKKDLLPDTWSPLRDDFPNGAEIALADLLSYTVSKSDNNGCDILIRLLGGAKNVQNYLRKIGVKDLAFVATEEEMHKSWDLQFKNWSKPSAMTKLLKIFYDGKFLSKPSTDFLWKIMVETSTGPNRIKGLLPKDTIVAHKTGTSGTNEQNITAAVNDVGIIELPNGKHFAITVFVSDSDAKTEEIEKVIAQISKATFDHFSDPKTFR